MGNAERRFHDLKCWPEFFLLSNARMKPFEYRKNDRDFRVGDYLALQEYCPRLQGYTGRVSIWCVTLVIDNAPGLPDGYVVMTVESVIADSYTVGEHTPDIPWVKLPYCSEDNNG